MPILDPPPSYEEYEEARRIVNARRALPVDYHNENDASWLQAIEQEIERQRNKRKN